MPTEAEVLARTHAAEATSRRWVAFESAMRKARLATLALVAGAFAITLIIGYRRGYTPDVCAIDDARAER